MRHQFFAKWVCGVAALVFVFVLVGCGDDSSGASDAGRIDAAVLDAAEPDAAIADASQPDAICGADVFYTGDYTDFDSTDISFLGIPDSMWVELGNPANTHTTPPNGRVRMCLSASGDTELRATHATYLPINVSVSIAGVQTGTLFGARGIKQTRLETLFTNLGLGTPTAGRAQLMVEIRRAGGNPKVGTKVSIGNLNDGAFTQDSTGTYVAGDTITDGMYVLFADVDVGGSVNDAGVATGSTTVTVTPPGGSSCIGRSSVRLVEGEISFTSFACD
jgi:hypothetical protein